MAAVAWVLAAAVATPLASACHYTTVTISNGTWCCGGEGGNGKVTTDDRPVLLSDFHSFLRV
jgi:hypothetical protein